MRIGINLLPWVPNRRGGLETYDRQLLRAFAESATDDRFVLFLSREAVGELRLGERFEEIACPVRSRYRPARALWEQFFFGAWVARGDARARAGVEVLFCPHGLAPARCAVPVVPTVHDLQVYDLPGNMPASKRAYLYRRLPAGARAAARIIAISEFTKQSVVRNLGAPAEKITVIHEAAGPEFFPRPAEETAATAARHGVAGPYFFCPATSHKHKNLDRLVRAFDALKTERGGAEQLVLTGLPGSGEAELREALRTARHGGEIHHLGRVDFAELPALYSGALALVFPSSYEGFGLPVLEAMACGCPVACSAAASLPEVAGEAALLFDGGSEGEIAGVMGRLREEPALRESLRERGLARASRFTWAETARQTLEVLREAGRLTAGRL
jgi:glycosyltransferase involved in cell wall biosynthesis